MYWLGNPVYPVTSARFLFIYLFKAQWPYLTLLFTCTFTLQQEAPWTLIRVDSLDLNGSNRNDIFDWISRKFKSTRSNPAQLVTDTVGRHSRGEESVPRVLSTYITVSRHRHCYCAVMSFSIVFPSCLCDCVRLASHLCLVFSFSSSPPPLYFLFSLCWMRRQVLGHQRMTASCR